MPLLPLLVDSQGYVNGRWASAAAGGTIAVINPATGEHLADVPDMGQREAAAAIESADDAMKIEVPLERRRRWLTDIVELLATHRDELARIITLEQGKPLKESLVEVDYARGFFRFFATQLDRLHVEPPKLIGDMRWTVHHRPTGVVGLITPWNFPIAMLAKKLAAAIGTGCASVTKPAELTPLTAIALWRLLETLDLPPGFANLVIGRPAPIGDALCAHPAVRLISFTGSTPVGKQLIANTALHVKRLALELGGNAPFIVFPDANLSDAAAALMANKFRCAGQTCVCANRVLVHSDVAPAFVDIVAARVAKLRVGNGMDPKTDVGPLINRKGFAKVDQHVRDALARGARLVVGGNPRPPLGVHEPDGEANGGADWGAFYPPTVLTGVTSEMLAAQEETFGPVIAVSTFASEDEAIRKANDTPYGLAAYVFTSDEGNGQRAAARLRFGHVGLNTGHGPTPEQPFGGLKHSGFGREGGVEGLLEFCEAQTIVQR